MRTAQPLRLALLALILVITVGCDQTTKHIARQHLSGKPPVALLSSAILLDLQENPGAFLGVGASLPGEARAIVLVLIAVALVLLSVHVIRTRAIGNAEVVAVALLVSGGISNDLYRLARHGKVTDFLLFRLGVLHTGVFNVADAGITVATVLLVIAVLRRRAA
jgi:signal peptidase II